MKRGAKKGSTHKGSANALLLEMEAGDRRWVETALEEYQVRMSRLCPSPMRRPPELARRLFKAQLFTAVSAGKAGDIRYLICIERVR